MKSDVQKVIDAWVILANELNKYKPNLLDGPFMPFKIEYIEGKYVLLIDISVFDEKKYDRIDE